MKVRTKILLSVVASAGLVIGFFQLAPSHRDQLSTDLVAAATWQRMAAPGELSTPHAFLENNCAACHTSGKGVEAQSCIVCHADNKTLLERQPTAFHANIGSCADCHLEHQGSIPRTTKMDHAALAGIGVRQLQKTPTAPDKSREELVAWLQQVKAPSHEPQLSREESLLNCASCHQSKDRHQGLFGADCASCHATEKWTIPEFRHPSSASQSCAECHQAPPSHYMMHFQMIDQKICAQPNATVNECFLCHQTTSWNDIRGVGWYKHH